MDKNETYLGNALVKRDGVQANYTEHEISEYVKCMKDPIYFAENYIKVISLDKGLIPFRPYEYQERMFKHFNDNRFSIVLACRQSGKCGRSDSYIYIKNKHTGEEEKITLKDFHERIKGHMPKNNSGIVA